MRARSIKPGICDNEILGTADPFYTLLFERLWMIADRKGRLEDRPLRIKAQAFPYREGLDVDAMLNWLADHEFICRYSVGAGKYIQILAFPKHQSPHKNEQESVIPAMDEQSTAKVVPPENHGSAKDALTPDSGLLTPDSGLLTEGHSRPPIFDGWEFVETRMRPNYPAGDFPGPAWISAARNVERIVETDGLPVLDAIEAGCRRFLAQAKARGEDDGPFIVNPDRFLTERRWTQKFPIPAPKQRTASAADRTTWRPDA